MEIHMAQVFTLCTHESGCDAATVGRVLNDRAEGEDGSHAAEGTHIVTNGQAPVAPHSQADAIVNAVQHAPDGRGIVLDRLYVGRDGRQLTSAQCARLAASLREVLLGEKSVEDVLTAAGKDVAAQLAPQRISIRNDLSDEHSVLTVVNDNVPGLLYYVTRALAALGLDIHSAKITTWAGRAEDAFYITRRNAASGGVARESVTFDSLMPDGVAADGMVDGVRDGAQASTQIATLPATTTQTLSNQKINDDEIKAVLEDVRRQLQKPIVEA
jgi:hypothetical protein